MSASEPVEVEVTYAMAETVLRVGLAMVTVVAVTDCVFAVAAGAGATVAAEGVVLTGLALAGVIRTDVAARLLRPAGRVVLVAGVLAAGGFFDAGLSHHYAEVAAAIPLVAALVSAARWVVLCWAVSAVGFVGALAFHGSSLPWMVGDGRYVVAGQLVNLAANGAAGLLMIALLRRFLTTVPVHLAAVRAGGESLTPQLALAASGRHAALLPAADARSLVATLTDAERAVLALLAEGRVPKQAARDLSIALPTVRSRIAAAKRKTGARTLEQLVALYATADGA